MTKSRQTRVLRLLNHTASPARLRFRSNQCALWDTWVAPGGYVAVPDPREADAAIEASLVDLLTNVTHGAPCMVTTKPVRLAAKLGLVAGAPCFDIEQEPYGQPGQIEMVNLTAADVRFSLRFLQSPYAAALVVGTQSARVLDLSRLDVMATVNGISTEAVPIFAWSGDLVVWNDAAAGAFPPWVKLSVGKGHRT